MSDPLSILVLEDEPQSMSNYRELLSSQEIFFASDEDQLRRTLTTVAPPDIVLASSHARFVVNEKSLRGMQTAWPRAPIYLVGGDPTYLSDALLPFVRAFVPSTSDALANFLRSLNRTPRLAAQLQTASLLRAYEADLGANIAEQPVHGLMTSRVDAAFARESLELEDQLVCRLTDRALEGLPEHHQSVFLELERLAVERELIAMHVGFAAGLRHGREHPNEP